MTALLIMGPTASGKSALALELARHVDGEIVNADSMQVYGDLRVLTARPTPEEEAQIPHHLYGHVDAAERYSAGRWVDDATAAITAIEARGRTPIVVGGTGLYFKALTEGLAPAPAAPAEVRARLAAELAQEGAEALHERLALIDPDAARRIGIADAPRILRALEVAESGEKLSELQQKAEAPLKRWRGFALWPEREALYAVIERRFDAMMAAGALDEVRALAARGLDPTLPAMKAHGAPALMAHLRGEIALAEAIEIAKRDTRRYAKRQFTWMAHQMPDWPRIADADLHARLVAIRAGFVQ
ncbi:MAG TPA: tRNA (adenosine(37)-N6)-dimethylallyltransferase MiaA [Caulobacterales bacterium]|nr:tRNA (adenosine(37)-N6)-dimethylallyltransferase MiaA [Caulobacterales bacterium]